MREEHHGSENWKRVSVLRSQIDQIRDCYANFKISGQIQMVCG